MQWTNVFKLPGPIEKLIREDVYHDKRDEQLQAYLKRAGLSEDTIHFSISDLIRSPRMRVLIKRHWKELVKDVSSEIFRLLGQAIHNLLREKAYKHAMEKDGYIAEERLFTIIKDETGRTIVISGEPDLVTPDGWIHDYKVVAVWSWLMGAKTEWEQQLNSYAWLRSCNGKPTSGLQICFILRDFNLNETMQDGYPQAGAQMEELTMWSTDAQYRWIMERVDLHVKAEAEQDDELLSECSPEEMWEKPESWAVMRKGNKRASRVFRSEELGKEVAYQAAEVDVMSRNQREKGDESPYYFEHRPGERTRCLKYCDARGFCSQFKEYTGAAFGKLKPEEVR